MKSYAVWLGPVITTDKTGEWLAISPDKDVCDRHAKWMNTGTAGGYEVLEVMIIPVKEKRGKKSCSIVR